MKAGYYWITFPDNDTITIGYYDNSELIGEYGEEQYKDGSGQKGRCYPWTIVGSDEIFQNDEIKIIREVK